MKYPEELIPKAKYELDVFERVSMDTGKELVAEVELLRALMSEAVRDFHGKAVLFSSAFLIKVGR